MNQEPDATAGQETAPASDQDSLQFDQAEYGDAQAAALGCAGCGKPIEGEYYQINGRPACPTCREAVQAARACGSGGGRTIKALLAGGLAGLLGTGIYFGVAAATGYEIGLVAVVVGLLVGGAVRWGSEARGGWYYQLLAVLMTYVAIAGAYSAFAIKEIISSARPTNSSGIISGHQAEPGTTDRSATNPSDDREAESAQGAPGAADWVRFAAVVLGLFLALPVLSMMESPMGILIVGIALCEAWKINHIPGVVVTGPFESAAPSGVPSS